MTDRWKLLAAMLVLWLGTVAAFTVFGLKIDANTKNIASNNKTLHTSQLRACHRLNLVRAEDNRSQLKDFELFTATLALIVKAQATSRQPLTAEQRAEAASYKAGIKADVEGKEWTPLTLCEPAVDHPDTYQPPEPVAFSVALPPSTALEVGPGQ